MASKFRNAGQTCVSTNRVLVHEAVHDAFVAKIKAAVEAQQILGDGMEAGVTQGPLINKSQHSKVCSMVEEAKEKGATVVIGGQASSVGELHYQPTILTGVTPEMQLCQEEIFDQLSRYRSSLKKRRLWISPTTAGQGWPATSTAETWPSAGGWGRLCRRGWSESTKE